MLTNIRVAFHYIDKERYDEKNHHNHDTPKVGICSCGMVSKLLKGYTERHKGVKVTPFGESGTYVKNSTPKV